jgi:HK97 family phage portal protein
MGFVSMVKGLYAGKKAEAAQMDYANFLEAQIPIFSLFGQNIYSHDLVQNCIDRIASEVSKLDPTHIRTDNTGMRNVVNSNINRLLRFGPNEIMDTGSFLEKITWLLFLNYNAFIYPAFDETISNGMSNRTYTGLYPLQPMIVEFLQDITGTMFLRLTFRNGEQFTLRYDNIIHLRKKFSVNASMGGGINGQPDNDAIQKTLDVNDVVIQGLEKAIRESLSIRGVVKINTLMDDDKLKAERRSFEEKLRRNEAGIIAMDLKGEYVPIQRDPEIIDKDTLDFIQQKVSNYYGVSMPILTGDYTDAQFEAFFQATIQPIIMSLGRNFSRVIFSPMELAVGNEIMFYQQNLSYLSTASKLNFLQIAGDQGLLTDNEKLEVLGYPPVVGGDRVTMSLNYIDRNLISQYQMGKVKTEEAGG